MTTATHGNNHGLSIRAIVGLIRRNLLLLAVGTLVGVVAALGATSLNRQYAATVIVEVAPGSDVGQTSTLVQSAASLLVSPIVIDAAARDLGIDPSILNSQVTSTVQAGTNLINVSAVSDSDQSAVDAATKVVNIALGAFRARSQERAKQVRDAGSELLANGSLDQTRAEAARQSSIGSVVGSSQGQAIQDTVSVSVASPALSAYRVGVSRPIGVILGAAGGFLIASLVALSRSWNRRRPIKTLSDLEYAGRLGGVLIETPIGAAGHALNHAKPAVLVLGSDAATRESLARTVVKGMLENGTRTALVVVTENAGPMVNAGSHTWEVGDDQVDTVMSRARRRRLPGELDVESVVICAPISTHTNAYLAGQDDYVAFVAVKRGTRVASAEDQFRLVMAADPIAVLAD